MTSKSLTVKDLSHSTAIRLFDLGYQASRCRDQAQFRKILEVLLEIFPADAVVCGYGKLEREVDVEALWSSRQLSDFSLFFRQQKMADQFKSLWDGVVPYLNNALLNAHNAANGGQQAGGRSLSPRQREVLKWLIEGKSNWEIGKILSISERTVKFHAQQLMRKFEAANRYHLVANALADQQRDGWPMTANGREQ